MALLQFDSEERADSSWQLEDKETFQNWYKKTIMVGSFEGTNW